MIPELVNSHDPHICLRVCYAIEMLHHRRFFGSLMRDVVSVTFDSTVDSTLSADVFSNHTTGQHFNITVNASFKSSNVIDLITCRRCGQQYVGKTEQEFHCTINGHRYDIMHKRTKKSHVAQHFNGVAHSQAE